MIITISGIAGSGKSSVAKLLAKKLGYVHYSIGDLQRKFAKEKGVSIDELNIIESKDDTLDRKVDEIQKKLGKEKDNFVIDSWLGFHFIPHSFKVFLECDENIAAKRIFNDVKAGKRDISEKRVDTPKEAIKIREQRQKTNRERWKRYYNVDFLKKSNYDLVINTTYIPVEKIVSKILEFIKKY